jgi:UTP--glucose-1-phosphate uridylyltransferase
MGKYMSITKAIIPVAGYGTRFLPITKTINKSMLPVLNRPVVDYIVQDCIKAGITEIIFVVLPNERQIHNYYEPNKKLEEYLRERGAPAKLKLITNINDGATFSFVKQPQNDKYGTAIPVALVEDLVKAEENFLVLMGDDFVYHRDNISEIAKLIDTHKNTGADATVACAELSKQELLKYSVVNTHKESGHLFFRSMIEKPKLAEITSNLGNVSKYVFSADIFKYVRQVQPNPLNGEYYLTDAVNAFAQKKHRVAVHTTSGTYLDCGTLEGWLNANQVVAKAEGIL